MIKMIVSDMDGTLLNSKKELPEDFIDLYRQMDEAGIRFVAASGRQFFTLREGFSHFNNNIIFVAENGGIVNWGDKFLVTKILNREEVVGLIKAIRSFDGANIVLCGRNSAYVENTNSEFLEEAGKYYFKNKHVNDLLEVEDEILKIAVCDFKNLSSVVLPGLKKFDDDFQMSSSSSIWVDIMPKGVNKGEAIGFLQEELSVKPEETMVFGDFLNDIEMLQKAHYSYSMANAHPDVKALARFSTDSNDENGVMKVVKEKLNAINVLAK